MTKAIDFHGVKRAKRAVSQAKLKISTHVGLELAEFITFIIDNY
jgi:hypothetical protein